MRKIPLLAALPLIIGCDDGERIKTRLSGEAVQAITEKLQTRCLNVIREGTVSMVADGDFKATLPLEECICGDQPPHVCSYAMFRGGWENPPQDRISVISAAASALVYDEDQELKIDVTINDGQECIMEQIHPGGRTDSMKSRKGYALEACRDFIKKAQDTVTAIRQRARVP